MTPTKLERPAITVEEAAFLVRICRAWQDSGRPEAADTPRLVYTDWLAGRNRPEEFVVRHYPPLGWIQFVHKQDEHNMPGQMLSGPWLPEAYYLSGGSVPSGLWMALAAVLEASGITGDPPLELPPIPYLARLRDTTCDGCGTSIFPTDAGALAFLEDEPTGTRYPPFCRSCNDPAGNPALAVLLAARCRVCGRPVFESATRPITTWPRTSNARRTCACPPSATRATSGWPCWARTSIHAPPATDPPYRPRRKGGGRMPPDGPTVRVAGRNLRHPPGRAGMPPSTAGRSPPAIPPRSSVAPAIVDRRSGRRPPGPVKAAARPGGPVRMWPARLTVWPPRTDGASAGGR
ncbi:MAG: hypothetical protein JWO38_4768 [Gemmataceae bacterium]|nr:hypothetical protein [Gemmataceae bacterium]